MFARSSSDDRAPHDEVVIGSPAAGLAEGATHPNIVAAMGSGGPYAALFGGHTPRAYACGVPAIRRGLLVIAGTIASLPLTRKRGDKLLELGWLERPEPGGVSVSKSVDSLVRDLVLYRFAWWAVTRRDSLGFPVEVVRLDPEWVTATFKPGTEQIEAVHAVYEGAEVAAEDLIRFDGPDAGLLACGAETIGLAHRLEEAAARYATPEIPTGVIESESQYDMSNPEIDKLLDRWENARRTRNTAFLGRGTKYRNILSTPEALQLVQAREECAVQLARLLGLPPHYVGAKSGDSMTYMNITAQRHDLIEIALAPYLDAIENTLSLPTVSPRGQQIAFDRNGFLRANRAERATIWATLTGAGIAAPSEARADFDLSGPAPKTPAPSTPTAPRPGDSGPGPQPSELSDSVVSR